MLQATEVKLPEIIYFCCSRVVIRRTNLIWFGLIGLDCDNLSQVYLNIIDSARAFRVINFDIEFNCLISEVYRLGKLCRNMNFLLSSATSTAEPSQTAQLLLERMARIPNWITNWLTSFLEVSKELIVELLIICILKLIHECLVFRITSKHWLEYCLRLKECLDLVLKLLLLDIFFNLFVCE